MFVRPRARKLMSSGKYEWGIKYIATEFLDHRKAENYGKIVSELFHNLKVWDITCP